MASVQAYSLAISYIPAHCLVTLPANGRAPLRPQASAPSQLLADPSLLFNLSPRALHLTTPSPPQRTQPRACTVSAHNLGPFTSQLTVSLAANALSFMSRPASLQAPALHPPSYPCPAISSTHPAPYQLTASPPAWTPAPAYLITPTLLLHAFTCTSPLSLWQPPLLRHTQGGYRDHTHPASMPSGHHPRHTGLTMCVCGGLLLAHAGRCSYVSSSSRAVISPRVPRVETAVTRSLACQIITNRMFTAPVSTCRMAKTTKTFALSPNHSAPTVRSIRPCANVACRAPIMLAQRSSIRPKRIGSLDHQITIHWDRLFRSPDRPRSSRSSAQARRRCHERMGCRCSAVRLGATPALT